MPYCKIIKDFCYCYEQIRQVLRFLLLLWPKKRLSLHQALYHRSVKIIKLGHTYVSPTNHFHSMTLTKNQKTCFFHIFAAYSSYAPLHSGRCVIGLPYWPNCYILLILLGVWHHDCYNNRLKCLKLAITCPLHRKLPLSCESQKKVNL